MTSPALTLHRARSAAPFASRGALAAALDWWREEAGCEGEWLLVPRLRLIAPSPAHSSPTALARQLNRALGAVREAATVDPAPGTWPPGALRFTRPERWLAWLAVRLATPDARVPQECAPLPEEPSVLKAQLRATLATEPRLLLTMIRILAAAGEFKTWAAGWDQANIEAIRQALTTHFAIEPKVLAILLDGEETFAPQTSALALPLAKPSLSAVQIYGSRAQARARRVIAASTQAPGLALLGPQRQTLARLLIGIAMAPPLAPQLAQVLAGPSQQRASTQRPERAAGSHHWQPGGDEGKGNRGELAAAVPHTRPAHLKTDRSPARPVTTRAAHRSSEARDGQSIPLPANRPAMRHARPARQNDPAPLAKPALFETRFGGLLFLLNAFTALGLYPDFTRPLDTRLEPSPCWLLERIGHHWFGRRFARDLLAKWLAGRAVAGTLPLEWRIDPEWEPVGPRPLRFKYLSLACAWDRRGFLAKAVPLRPRDRNLPAPPLKLTRNLRRLPLEAEPWLSGFLSYLDWRLSAADLRRADLCLPAQLHWQDDCASLRLPLAQLPIALRMAGLDRDPGWLPAEGCNFRFEFA